MKLVPLIVMNFEFAQLSTEEVLKFSDFFACVAIIDL